MSEIRYFVLLLIAQTSKSYLSKTEEKIAVVARGRGEKGTVLVYSDTAAGVCISYNAPVHVLYVPVHGTRNTGNHNEYIRLYFFPFTLSKEVLISAYLVRPCSCLLS